jgi:hypothetical protein
MWGATFWFGGIILTDNRNAGRIWLCAPDDLAFTSVSARILRGNTITLKADVAQEGQALML